MTCLSLITTLGMLDPNSAIPVMLDLLDHSTSAHLQPPPELVHRALQCLCSLVATAEGGHHIAQATTALVQEPDGLLAHHRFQCDEVLLALQLLSQLAQAFLLQHGSSSSAGGQCCCDTHPLTHACLCHRLQHTANAQSALHHLQQHRGCRKTDFIMSEFYMTSRGASSLVQIKVSSFTLQHCVCKV